MVVKTNTITMSSTKRKFRVKMTSKMAPSARLIVYYIADGGEIIADSVDFNVEGVFKNEVMSLVNNLWLRLRFSFTKFIFNAYITDSSKS